MYSIAILMNLSITSLLRGWHHSSIRRFNGFAPRMRREFLNVLFLTALESTVLFVEFFVLVSQELDGQFC